MSEKMIVPFVILDRVVIFPNMMMHFDIEPSLGLTAVENAYDTKCEVFITRKKEKSEIYREEDDIDRQEDMEKLANSLRAEGEVLETLNPDEQELPDYTRDDPHNAQSLNLKEESHIHGSDYGTVAQVKQLIKLPNGKTRVLVIGVERAKVTSLVDARQFIKVEVEVEPITIMPKTKAEEEGLYRTLQDTVKNYLKANSKVGKEIGAQLLSLDKFATLLQQSIFMLPMPAVMRQKILDAPNDFEQFRNLFTILNGEMQILRVQSEIQSKVQRNIDKNQREYVLHEQLRVIREELGDNGPLEDAEEFTAACNKLKAPEEIKEVIRMEIRRYTTMGTNNGEGGVIRNYIETMLALPWDKESKDNLDIANAERILERDHYGLKDVKERVLQFLAVRAMTNNINSPIVLLVGPPGTGKTSIAKSIAEALGRKYVRICLGGVRDEAEIRGHRRTYIASMPGRFIQGIRQAGVKNPLMLLDEVDKIGSDYKGDPSAALLEVLDSAQNNKFVDHFIEQPVDLSKVVFLATANSMETIPKPLLDRMEIIEIKSYTLNEKVHIAKEHLVPKMLKQHGLTKKDLTFTDKALVQMIQSYTREAGVRSLERRIGEVCRKADRQILESRQLVEVSEETACTAMTAKTPNKADKPKTVKIKITDKNLEEFLGRKKFREETFEKKPLIGTVRGLAWTSVGGTTLEIEVATMPGKGQLELTGNLGDVMKESAKTALSYVRSIAANYGVAEDFFEKHDLHIHVPEGATPKDGPSAGITMATAILSAISKRPVWQDLAMTGEITLRGRVTAIGGLPEKLLAAKMLGITKVLVPEENKEDVSEISEEILEALDIKFVRTMEEVLSEALSKESK